MRFQSDLCPKMHVSVGYRRNKLWQYAMRGDTGVADEARYSAPPSGLSLSNTVSILKLFGVKRARSTVRNWVHKANL